jgi:uncharacterized protein YdeI (YjbR/CyaY-like superfamily)
MNLFIDFLEKGIAAGGFSNDDIVEIILPLLEEVYTFHLENKVAPLHNLGTLLITHEKLDIDEQYIREPSINMRALSSLKTRSGNALDITDEYKEVNDAGAFYPEHNTLQLLKEDEAVIERPVFLKGYRSYEIELGHHDALTDIFVLGLILGSLATNSNLGELEYLEAFVSNRKSLQILNSKIHPAIANVVTEMTQPDRAKRARDLGELILKLKNYRDYNPEAEYAIDVNKFEQSRAYQNKDQWVISRLRNRLFDLSRRNRLLYFKPSLKFLNLTEASFPLTLSLNYVKPEHLFVWDDKLQSSVQAGKEINLSKYIRQEENPYIISYLEKIRLEAQSDINEYGFSQLRLAVCFLSWYNKEVDPKERINSPLVLLPVAIKKKKGLKDQYTLEITSAEAEINPVLSHNLREVYGIQLPSFVPLEVLDIHALYNDINKQVLSSASGVKLELVDKPRIKIIHAQARQTLAHYNKRLRNKSKSIQSYHDLDYSYERDQFQPLGLEIYKHYVQPSASYLEYIINEEVKPRGLRFAEEKERTLYSVDTDTANPFVWEMNLCSVTLGNFNYRKMSLVRDYNEIAENNLHNKVFSEIFSNEPRKRAEDIPVVNSMRSMYPVVHADPTQIYAIKSAKGTDSFIIQGPPGTGKSQTITNLIADFAARGKTVLFVCEKRAAIDVVFHRLQQHKLDELCCLIHDSQSDKKSFVMNLKATYEQYLKQTIPLKEAEEGRAALIDAIDAELLYLHRFNDAMAQVRDSLGTHMKHVIERLIILDRNTVEADAVLLEILPEYKAWMQHGEQIAAMQKRLEIVTGSKFLADSAIRKIKPQALQQEGVISGVKEQLEQIGGQLKAIGSILEAQRIPGEMVASMDKLKQLIEAAAELKQLADKKQYYLLVENSKDSKELDKLVAEFKKLSKKLQASFKKTQYWSKKLPQQELKEAARQIGALEVSFFKIFSPTYRKLKKVFQANYDFSKHQVVPAFASVAQDLLDEYAIEEEIVEVKGNTAELFEQEDPKQLYDHIDALRKRMDTELHRFFLNNAQDGYNTARQLGEAQFSFTTLDINIRGLLHDASKKSIEEIEADMQAVNQALKQLQELLPDMRNLFMMPDSLQKVLREHTVDAAGIEALIADKTLQAFYRFHQHIAEVSAGEIEVRTARIEKMYEELLAADALYIRAVTQHKFGEHINQAAKSVTQLNQEERQFKKQYTEGRKILEHEFGKQMRYKSIRELASAESGDVIRDLKPVWLMSPLSVSDTLPLVNDFFDVVIFDEASQITLEEGVPSLFRAPKAIIVGDEMQMPPTSFFSTASNDEEDITIENQWGDKEFFSIDADSLLTQAARKLNSTMLGWHYRSRHESLISYSNAAFYNRGLLTVPDVVNHDFERNEIVATREEIQAGKVSFKAERPISYHYLQDGVYEKRSNKDEANYIALLVKDLLQQHAEKSIGIVAFSMEQQGEIENALEALAQSNTVFAAQLEAGRQRMEAGQFAGLFVKNLENVQGDERDVIILSICYGFDRHGKMLMNFGPINRKGGEKRLNVIFSRAKHHVAVVSSIRHQDIKNEYNEGANYLRRYLQYAELVSKGNMEQAALVLNGLSKVPENADAQGVNLVARQLGTYLQQQGFEVTYNTGQSHFRCDVAVRRKGEHAFCAGILVDTDLHYRNEDVLEQYVLRPQIMRSFGWNIIPVLTKDWLENKTRVCGNVLRKIGGAKAN